MSTSKTTIKKPAAPVAMARAQYFMPPAMKENLEVLSARKGVSAAELVRQAVSGLLKRNGLAAQ
jgi:hypothetical protein